MTHAEMMKQKALLEGRLDECGASVTGRRAAMMRFVLEMLVDYCDHSTLKEVRVAYLGNVAREVLNG